MYLEGSWANDQLVDGVGRVHYVNGDWYRSHAERCSRSSALKHDVCRRYEGGIREAKRHGMGVMLYADGCVFGGLWEGDLKADGVFIDGSGNWTCGTWDGFVALQAVARVRVVRERCLYSGDIRQGQRYCRPPPPLTSHRIFIINDAIMILLQVRPRTLRLRRRSRVCGRMERRRVVRLWQRAYA
jgi:hypothetical protein